MGFSNGHQTTGILATSSWITGQAYKANDVVMYSGLQYRVKADHTSSSVPTSDTTNYEILNLANIGASGLITYSNGTSGVIGNANLEYNSGAKQIRMPVGADAGTSDMLVKANVDTATGTASGYFGIMSASGSIRAGARMIQSWNGSSSDYSILLQTHKGGVGNISAIGINPDGTIGFGTSNPTIGKFHFTGGHLAVVSGGAISANISGTTNALSFQSSGGTGEHAIVAGGSSSANFLSFYTANSGTPTIKMTISAAGEVGIGVAPTSARQLHIKGSALTQRYETTGNITSSGVNYQEFYDSVGFVGGVGYAGASNIFQIATNTASGQIRFLAGSQTEIARVTTTGLGIHNTSPANALDIGSSTVTASRIIALNSQSGATTTQHISFNITSTENAYLALNNSGSAFAGLPYPSFGMATGGGGFPIAFSPNGSVKMIITPTGVSIGTATNPSYPLDLVADSNAIGINIRGRTADSLGVLRFVNNGNSSENARITVTDADIIFFATGSSSTDRMSIDASGNGRAGADNAYTWGTASLRWSAIYAANGTIQTSDQREKTDIQTSSLGLEFIKAVNPVQYKWIVGGNSVAEDGTVTPVAGVRTHFGVLAQQVKSILPEGVDFGGWVLTDKNNPDSTQAIRYDQFIAPIIKAIQELSADFEAYKLAHP